MIRKMEKHVPLDYRGFQQDLPRLRLFSKRCIAALIAGLVSGPVGVGAAYVVALATETEFLGLFLLIASHLAAIEFCLRTLTWMKHRQQDLRGRGLAIGGIVATLAWIFVEFCLLLYILIQIN